MSTTPVLTTRRAILLSELADGKTMAQATATARMQRQSGYEALEEMRALVPKVMDDVGLDVHSILARIREKCDAHETKFFQCDGRVTETVDVEAHGIQLKAIELAASLRPELAQVQDKLNIGTVNILWAGDRPGWAKPSNEALVNASVNAKANDSVSVLNGNQPESTPAISTIEGTPSRPGPPTNMHCPGSSNQGVLTQRIVKKRGPRLPVYKGRK